MFISDSITKADAGSRCTGAIAHISRRRRGAACRCPACNPSRSYGSLPRRTSRWQILQKRSFSGLHDAPRQSAAKIIVV
jgi:hypothetical protein